MPRAGCPSRRPFSRPSAPAHRRRHSGRWHCPRSTVPSGPEGGTRLPQDAPDWSPTQRRLQCGYARMFVCLKHQIGSPRCWGMATGTSLVSVKTAEIDGIADLSLALQSKAILGLGTRNLAAFDLAGAAQRNQCSQQSHPWPPAGKRASMPRVGITPAQRRVVGRDIARGAKADRILGQGVYGAPCHALHATRHEDVALAAADGRAPPGSRRSDRWRRAG